ncbi:MAG: protein kinase [Planctomycetota bacterium]
MSPAELEDLVAEFLDRRERDPQLQPAAFAATHPGVAARLRAAIEAALAAADLLPDAAADVAMAPRAIGPYRVVGTLGRGGMGVVYDVERDGQRFALKWLPLAPVLGARVHERLRRESRILERLEHPHIVRIRDTGLQDEAPYLVMERIDGAPLAEAAAAMPVDDRVRLVVLLCRAVHAAHEAGVVHRDLKPQNVLVRADGAPVLLDFGLGAAEELPTLTGTGDVVGTPRYMAPEQVREQRADRRTDVHALGLVLYELVTGRPAYPEDSRERVFAAIGRGRFVRPRRLQPTVPPELEKVILVAMAWQPARRFATAAAMADDLERYLQGEPVRARPPGPLQRALLLPRLYPERAVAGGLLVLLVAAAAWLAATPAALSETERQQLRGHYADGIAAWLDGDADGARAALRRALDIDPDHAGAGLLLRHCARGPRDALDELAPAAAALPRDALTSVVQGLAAVEEREWDRAEQELVAASLDLPPSRFLAESLGDVHRSLRRFADAERDYRTALAIGPETARTWGRLAEIYRELENPDAGIEAAETALRLSGRKAGRTARVLASLYGRRNEYARAEALLRELLAEDPDDVAAMFELACTLDSQHDAGCRTWYGRVLEHDPAHASALINLANLHTGADRGHCVGCDRMFAEHPDLFDPALATELLLRALQTRHGGNRALLQNSLGIAARLPDRQPLIELLRRLTDGAEQSPETLNRAWLLRRLELNAGLEGR